MTAGDLRRRAEWLRAVAARLPSKEAARFLVHYAHEIDVRADAWTGATGNPNQQLLE